MNNWWKPLSTLLTCCCCISCHYTPAPSTSEATAQTAPYPAHPKINGLTLVAPPNPFPANPMPPVRDVAAGWIAVVPYGFTPPNQATVVFADQSWKWWGETTEGTSTTIRLAHEAGIKVMLKPQIYIPGNWTGNLDFPSEKEWETWEKGYTHYILHFAQLAATHQVELFCVGTEFNLAIQKRTSFWIQLIQKIKSIYPGKLVYSANWDDWERVPFWKHLDFIGMGGYFPLVSAPTPDTKSLAQAWIPIRDRLQQFSLSQQRPILFTEYGYLSVDSCGWRNWELEQGIQSRKINEKAQANCLDALHQVFQPEPWWAGGFLWKWFPNGEGHEGYPERDYTPQRKIGEQILKKWFTSQEGARNTIAN